MKSLRFILGEFVRVVTFESAITEIKLYLQDLRVLKARKKAEHADRAVKRCIRIHHPAFHRPDPLIYSQKYLLSLGLAVTWDNPDIVLLRNGVIVSEGDLLPNTEYEIDATIWNNSFEAPVVGLTVDFSFLAFGAGTIKQNIGSRVVNLGVKGGTDHPAHARIPWRTPPAGHYCIQVDLKWADDVNPNNNLGQNNVDVVSPQSPATFTFQLRNDGERRATYTFQVDTYTLPTQKDCGERITRRSNDQKWSAIKALHDRSKYFVSSDWTITVTSANVELSPDDEVPIVVSIEPPPGFTGNKAFNVHALRNNSTFTGGVTVFVSKL